MTARRVVIFASGNGSNAQVLMDQAATGQLDCQIAAVVSDQTDAPVLDRAVAAGVRTEVLEPQPGEPRDRYDNRLAPIVARYQPDLVVLAGWMRILTGDFCRRFNIINLHPALPGMFPGPTAVNDAFASWRAGEVDETGVMVHWVPDAAVDQGPLIVSESVPFRPDDTVESVGDRIHAVEHRLLPLGVTVALQTVSGSLSSINALQPPPPDPEDPQ